MLEKIRHHKKSSRSIDYKSLSDSRISIESNECIDAGCHTQQATYMCSSRTSKILMQCYPNFLEDSYGHFLIDNTHLTTKTKQKTFCFMHHRNILCAIPGLKFACYK